MGYRYFFFALLVLVFFCGGQLHRTESTGFVTDAWTGTLTMTERYDGITGWSERRQSVTFSGAIPTLYREDVDTTDIYNFSDDKGTGSVEFKGEEIIEGKRIGTTQCTGGGQAELHEVAIDEAGGTYSIEAIPPPCNGTSVSLLDGSTQPYGPEVTNIVVPDQPLRDPNVLAGSLTEGGEIVPGGDIGTFSRTITWNLVRRRPADAELIVTLTCGRSTVAGCTYDTWLPEPGPTEAAPGSSMKVSLKLQGVNGRPLGKKATAFELRLTGTSKEPGTTVNFPLGPNNQLPDLGFIPSPGAAPKDEFQTVTVSCPATGCTTAEVQVGSFDGGGWTTLTAVAILQDRTRISGHLLVSQGVTEMTIPKRGPNSNIAESWLAANGSPKETVDDESFPGNPNVGDGLTAYEEYRGVISEGKFRRLDPQRMELGIRMNRGEFGLFSQGIALFESATGIKPIRFDETEIGEDRKLNRHKSHSRNYEQFCENLENKSLPGDAVGENQPTNVTAKLPAQSEHVIIDIAKIRRQYQGQAGVAAAARVRIPYTEAEEIANTVAHELAHGINVNHHGMPSLEPDHFVPERSVDTYHIFADDGVTEITRDLLGKTLKGIGKAHNDESGDLSCIMAYTSLYNWAYRIGSDGSLNFYKVPLLPVGKKMCRGKTDTAPGINANNRYFGDAAYGDCFGQMKLRS